MSGPACRRHPDTPALYRCESCGEPLCQGCVEEGHRLLFCGLCGERALPLDERLSARVPELERQRKRNQVYTLQDALLYPFRGIGAYAFWSFVGLLTALELAAVVIALVPLFCIFIPVLLLVAIAIHLLLLLIMPGFLFSIIGETAKGENELPDWPDWSDFSSRFTEMLAFVTVLFFAGLLIAGMLTIAGCHPATVVMGGLGPGCLFALIVSLIASLALAVPAWGAVGTWGMPSLVLRLDLHVRAVAQARGELWQTVLLVAGLLIAGRLLRNLVPEIPVIGTFFFLLIGSYALFTGAHLTGLLFRQQHDRLEAIYFPKPGEG